MAQEEYIASMNAALKDLYASKWPALNRIMQDHDGVSWPLLLKVPREYGQASLRLLVVGQQTRGWVGYGDNAEADPVTWLIDGYSHFDLGRNHTRSPFWQASHELYASLNSEGPPSGFVWSNLVKVDQDDNRPAEDIEEAVCQLGLLSAELQIVRPGAVVFFTGPRYDSRLCSTFPSLRFVPEGEDITRLEHAILPLHTYRTPHPKYLRLSKRWATLMKLAQRIGRHG